MRKKNTLVVVHLSMAVVGSVAILITEQTWAYVWISADIVLGCIRLSIHLAYEKAESDGAGTATPPLRYSPA
jgi:hypothetical protein